MTIRPFLVAFAVFAAASCKAKREPTPTLAPTVLPSLCIAPAAGTTSQVDWPRAFSYIFTNLDAAGRAELRDVLTGYGTRLEAHLNPLLEDLFDGEPKDDLTRWARKHGPLVQTSISLATMQVSFDGARAITLTVDPPADAGCLPIWGTPSESGDLRKARFVAWPYAASFVVRMADPMKHACAREALRALVGEGATFGMVLDGAESAPMTNEEVEVTGRVMTLEAMSQKHKWTAARSRSRLAGSTGDPPMNLAPSDLLVAPRLLRVDDLPALRSEIDTLVSRCAAKADVFAADAFP